eukprot:2546886-Lingulodinium_polyedra.AAC.1
MAPCTRSGLRARPGRAPPGLPRSLDAAAAAQSTLSPGGPDCWRAPSTPVGAALPTPGHPQLA